MAVPCPSLHFRCIAVLITFTFAVLAPSFAMAGTDCRTYRSGSETITVCSDTSNPKRSSTTCRSSGPVLEA